MSPPIASAISAQYYHAEMSNRNRQRRSVIYQPPPPAPLVPTVGELAAVSGAGVTVLELPQAASTAATMMASRIFMRAIMPLCAKFCNWRSA